MLLAGLPLAFILVWLPFKFGGRSPGWLAAAEIGTFGVVALLALTGRLALPRAPAMRRVLWVMAVAAGGAAVSTVFSKEVAGSIPQLIEWLWLGAEALLVAFVAQHRRGREALGTMLLIAVFAESFWSYYQWWGSQIPSHQQVGTFFASNQYAGYVLLLAPLCLGICFTSSSWFRSATTGFAGAFLYLSITLSGSRGGVLAAALGLVVMVALAWRRWPLRTLARVGMVAACVGALSLVLTGPLLFPPAKGSAGAAGALSLKGTDSTDLTQRLHWDLGALEIGRRNPLAGTGLGTFGAMFSRVQKPQWQWSKWAHNQYLETFAEGGLFLFAAMVALPLLALRSGLQGLGQRLTEDDFWRLGLGIGLLGGAVHLVIDHDWSYPAYAAAFVAVAVLAVAPWERLSAEPRPSDPPHAEAYSVVWLWPHAVVLSLSVLCVAAVVGQSLSGALQRSPSGNNLRRLRVAAALAPYATGPFEKQAELEALKDDRPNLRRAAALLQSAISRDQLSASLRWKLAAVDRALGDLPGARAAYQSAIAIAPLSAAAYVQAAAFEAQGAHDLARAIQVIDQGIGLLQRMPLVGGENAGLAILMSARQQLVAGARPA